MSKSWGDREALDAQEPRAAEEPSCPLCGTRVAHPFEPGGTVLCHPDRGGCGAIVRPVPFLASVDEGEGVEAETGPPRVWEGCCRPFHAAGRVLHSRTCPARPRKALGSSELEGWRAENRAKLEHPAGLGSYVTDASGVVVDALRLLDDEGYIDAHMDDDDDYSERGRW